MRVRYLSTDDVQDIPDDAADVLIEAGICERYEELSREAQLLTPEAPLETTAVTHRKRRP